jgi:hypothetical protein
MQFYPRDWINDTRVLSLKARGVWIDLCCAMWTAEERGKLEWTFDIFARFIGLQDSPSEALTLFDELKDSHVGVFCLDNVTQAVTVMSRRMIREESERKQARMRQSRKRHGNVTG